MNGIDASLILLFVGFSWVCTLVVIKRLNDRVSFLEMALSADEEVYKADDIRANERWEKAEERWKETNERLENLENRRFVIVSKPTPDGVKFELEEREKVEGGYWRYSEDDSDDEDEEAEEVDGEEEETDGAEGKADGEEEKKYGKEWRELFD